MYTLTRGFSGNARLASVNPLTGSASQIGSGVGKNMISLEISQDGTMYGVGYNDQVRIIVSVMPLLSRISL
jgi:hypothetical protein